MTTKTQWKLHWKSYLVIIGLLIALAASFYMSLQPVDDLNELNNVPVRNTDWHWVYDGEDETILQIWRIVNATTAGRIDVLFWYNATYLSNVTNIYFVYYNGTHSSDLPANKTHENGYPNTYWWTETGYTFPDLYVNRSSQDPIGLTIPQQLGNTTVEFRVVLRMEDGVNLEYKWWGGNFTVRFSDADNAEVQTVYTTYWNTVTVFSALMLFSLLLFSYIVSEDSVTALKEEAEKLRISTPQPNYPTTGDLIDRAEKLESMKSDLRTASSLLLGLASAIFYLVGMRSTYFSLGLVFLILASLGSIVLSLTGSRFKHEGSEIDESLLPFDESNLDFDLLLRMVIVKRRQVLSLMRTALELGVAAVIVGVFADSVNSLIVTTVGTLQSSQFANIWTVGAGYLVPLFVGTTILFMVWASLRAMGVADWEVHIFG